MKNNRGKYVTQSLKGDIYQAYIPPTLPLHPPLDLTSLYPLLEKATQALATLNTMHVPNTALFIYMYVRKEALLSSQIEGTQSSFSDLLLFENTQHATVCLEDVEEVSHYVEALTHGLTRLQEGFPLSLRLLREMHEILLSGGRGSSKTPGQWRKEQNWIGGTKPSNALFVPPSVDYLQKSLNNFEQFLHDTSLPVLIKVGIAHVQFETIHPFLDGNGRIGRLLIILLLCESGLLKEPILYISLYLKTQRALYYNLLQEVRLHDRWNTWLEFFLEAIITASEQACTTATTITKLFEEDQRKIESLGRARFSCLQVFEYLKKLPQVSPTLISKELNISLPTARAALEHLARLQILEEISTRKRDKVYVYRKYLSLLEEDTEAL